MNLSSDRVILRVGIIVDLMMMIGMNSSVHYNIPSILGFRYGSLVEDYFTGYRLQCEGWESVYCHPSRPAFLVCLLAYMVTDPWFLLYAFVFIGAYGQDCYDFILFGSTFKRWWNDQRMWLIRGLSPLLFALVEYIAKHLGITTQGFNVTSKVQDDDQRKRYDQGLIEFGVHSVMFLPLITATILGFRYGSLVEDYFTVYRLQCEGWVSVYCHPSRLAFLGDVPISLIDVVSQTKRWAIGILEMIDPWFLLYASVFIGAYGQDCYDFILFGSTFKRWWNDQLIWLIRGLSPFLFALVEYIAKNLGIVTQGFNATSKMQDDEQRKRYDQALI
ncbi:hypothetical protein L2E82_47868 [Cichorium intybus]|uniref:Uncharacterized protein n=1 Tax=Cichorium intybus TaxID=13427 RepID=A0ACB8YXR6_CICIN|nr:hypothetical protein L2E82_47868 [Cichorium intybus]